MRKIKDFYIGWKDEISDSSKSVIKIFLMVVFGLMTLVVAFYVPSQNKFADSTYDAGNITEYEGYLFLKPFPTLVSIDPDGKRESILLVGYGKFGAEATIDSWEKENDKGLDNILVKLRGTRIEYKGQILLELTDKDDFIKWIDENQSRDRKVKKLGKVSLNGEIVDSKCYFGGMKPGYGKTHRSCAVRCLSGGIPPVLIDENGKSHVILLPENTRVSALFDLVSKQVALKGESLSIDNQLYLKVSPEMIKTISLNNPVLLDQYITYCIN